VSTLELIPPMLRGLVLTVEVFAGGAVVALVCAFASGLCRISRDPILRGLAGTYIEVFRGTSALVQLYWFYFALPMLLGIELPAVAVGIIVLGLNIGAYGGEVVRAAIRAVPRGQHEAAVALNLTRHQRLRHVIVPQALPAMLPPLGNLMIELLKSTALVSMITVADLTRVGIELRDETLRSAEIFGLLLVLYFCLSLVVTAVVRRIERWASRGMSQKVAT